MMIEEAGLRKEGTGVSERAHRPAEIQIDESTLLRGCFPHWAALQLLVGLGELAVQGVIGCLEICNTRCALVFSLSHGEPQSPRIMAGFKAQRRAWDSLLRISFIQIK